jgi:hypothetical protein
MPLPRSLSLAVLLVRFITCFVPDWYSLLSLLRIKRDCVISDLSLPLPFYPSFDDRLGV